MERKRSNFRLLATYLYAAFFATYLFIGFQPAGKSYEISGQLSIPSVSLSSPVTDITLEGKALVSPESIVGAYSINSTKTLLIAHSTTAFKNLSSIQIGDKIYYENRVYQVTDLKTLSKNEIDMRSVLSATKQPTLVLMTCAGTSLGNHDATHRLLVTAQITEKDVIIE